MKILLKKEYFTQCEEDFATGNEVGAALFRYSTGICGVKLTNSLGYITVLPFNGQMIWDAEFYGRSLKMRMPFPEPRDAVSFFDTYGCYVMHCGVLGMGGPSPQDKHAYHGELPCAHYDSAYLVTGMDERGEYIGVTGTYEYNRAFGDHYAASPLVKLYAGSTMIDISMHIENLSVAPLELMYLCHINNDTGKGGEIEQTLPWDKEHMDLRPVQAEGSAREFIDKVRNDVRLSRRIGEQDEYNPEAVFFMHGPGTDADGWAHFLYIHPDGSADYTTYKPAELDHCIRWITRAAGRSALGLAMPATADAEGHIAEKKKGNIKLIPPNGSFRAGFKAGYLTPCQAAQIKEKINGIQ